MQRIPKLSTLYSIFLDIQLIYLVYDMQIHQSKAELPHQEKLKSNTLIS